MGGEEEENRKERKKHEADMRKLRNEYEKLKADQEQRVEELKAEHQREMQELHQHHQKRYRVRKCIVFKGFSLLDIGSDTATGARAGGEGSKQGTGTGQTAGGGRVKGETIRYFLKIYSCIYIKQ